MLTLIEYVFAKKERIESNKREVSKNVRFSQIVFGRSQKARDSRSLIIKLRFQTRDFTKKKNVKKQNTLLNE